MKNTFSIFNIIKFSFHCILTFIVFYYSYLLALKFILIINPNENLLLTIIYSIIILAIINYIFFKFIVMTIIAGIFNYYNFEKLNVIKFVTYISSLISVIYVLKMKFEICQTYLYKEVIFIAFTILVISTLKFITEVYTATLNLKLITTENYIMTIDNGLITPYEAIEQIKNNENITNQKRFEIIEVLENKYKKILEEGDRNQEMLMEYYRKNKDKL